MKSRIFEGIRGWIKSEINHTGIGILFTLVNAADIDICFSFSERQPVGGPTNMTYTKAFLSVLQSGKGRVHQERGQVIVDTVKSRTRIKYYEYGAHSTDKECCVYFNAKQIKILAAYLEDYINTLPQNILNDIKKYQQDCWVFST